MPASPRSSVGGTVIPRPRSKIVCYVLALSVVTGGRQPALPYRGETAAAPPSASWPRAGNDCGGGGPGAEAAQLRPLEARTLRRRAGLRFPFSAPELLLLCSPAHRGSHYSACVNSALDRPLLPTGC